MSDVAVLNANYVLACLKDVYDLPYDRLCMHEFVLSARTLKREHSVTALDVAKGLMDRGIHPPTVYFPLVVPEALMIEPTETETRERLDTFIEAMRDIAEKAATDPRTCTTRPITGQSAGSTSEGGEGARRSFRVRRDGDDGEVASDQRRGRSRPVRGRRGCADRPGFLDYYRRLDRATSPGS